MTFNLISWISHYDDANDSMINPPCPSWFLLDCLQNWQCLWCLIHTFRLCYLGHTILKYYIFKYIPQYYPNMITHRKARTLSHLHVRIVHLLVFPFKWNHKHQCASVLSEQYRFLEGYQGCCSPSVPVNAGMNSVCHVINTIKMLLSMSIISYIHGMTCLFVGFALPFCTSIHFAGWEIWN